MGKDPEFADQLPDEETIEQGRRSSLTIGLIIGAAIVGIGIICYLLFGKYFM